MHKSDIGAELLARSRGDQAMRNKVIETGDWSLWDDDIDKENTAYLKNVVANGGWPSISSVDKATSEAACMVACAAR